MKVTKYLFLAAAALPMVLISCRGQVSEETPVHPNLNMDQQNRFEQQERNEFFEDNRAMRQPVEGTISRGNLRQDKGLYQGINEDSSFVTKIPVELTKSFMYRGKDRYEVYCTPCHGIAGDGQGIVMTGNYGFVPAPSFHIDRLRDKNDGYFYSVISNGIRNMPSYAQQIPVKDRWAIVSYVRALQKSQNATEKEINKYDVDLASMQEDFKNQQAAAAKKEKAAQNGDGEVSAERGKVIAEDNVCGSCHSTDGSKIVGPTWQNLYGHEVELEDGSTVTANEEYIRESIKNPTAKIVKGFPPSMVPYDHLSESEINSLIAYIKTLSNAAPDESQESTNEDTPSKKKMNKAVSTDTTDTVNVQETLTESARRGKKLFTKHECLSCHTIEGSKELAPMFKGLFGSKRTLSDGSTVIADEGYIKESIQYPGAKVALGFNDNMPSFRDLMDDQQLQAVTDYIKALR